VYCFVIFAALVAAAFLLRTIIWCIDHKNGVGSPGERRPFALALLRCLWRHIAMKMYVSKPFGFHELGDIDMSLRNGLSGSRADLDRADLWAGTNEISMFWPCPMDR